MQVQVSAPTPQAPVLAPAAPGQATATSGPATAAQMYEALRMQRRELDRQYESLQDRRGDLSRELLETPQGNADRQGLEARITETDARLASVERQIAANDEALATAAAIPGAVQDPPPPPPREGPPEEAFIVAIVFTALLLLPIVIAHARRIWRRSSTVAPGLPPELWQRLTRLEEGVDAVAVEIERIGEGQRFTNKIFAESRSLGAGAAQPIEQRAGEPVRSPTHEQR